MAGRKSETWRESFGMSCRDQVFIVSRSVPVKRGVARGLGKAAGIGAAAGSFPPPLSIGTARGTVTGVRGSRPAIFSLFCFSFVPFFCFSVFLFFASSSCFLPFLQDGERGEGERERRADLLFQHRKGWKGTEGRKRRRWEGWERHRADEARDEIPGKSEAGREMNGREERKEGEKGRRSQEEFSSLVSSPGQTITHPTPSMHACIHFLQENRKEKILNKIHHSLPMQGIKADAHHHHLSRRWENKRNAAVKLPTDKCRPLDLMNGRRPSPKDRYQTNQ